MSSTNQMPTGSQSKLASPSQWRSALRFILQARFHEGAAGGKWNTPDGRVLSGACYSSRDLWKAGRRIETRRGPTAEGVVRTRTPERSQWFEDVKPGRDA